MLYMILSVSLLEYESGEAKESCGYVSAYATVVDRARWTRVCHQKMRYSMCFSVRRVPV
jgi:hypothetical protein